MTEYFYASVAKDILKMPAHQQEMALKNFRDHRVAAAIRLEMQKIQQGGNDNLSTL
ncbi:MAG: hypothetical protein AB7G62_01340 [Magnetospirillum sp.]